MAKKTCPSNRPDYGKLVMDAFLHIAKTVGHGNIVVMAWDPANEQIYTCMDNDNLSTALELIESAHEQTKTAIAESN